MRIGERIRQRRESLGITQTELAYLVGSTKQNIYKYENGIITNIPSDRVEALAVALRTTPSALMGWDEERPRGLKLGCRAKEFKSDKGTRLNCKIDSELYDWLAAAADANDRTVEDEVEERLYWSIEADFEEYIGVDDILAGAYRRSGTTPADEEGSTTKGGEKGGRAQEFEERGNNAPKKGDEKKSDGVSLD